MVVTYRAATSTTVTLSSRSGSVMIRGWTLEACANIKLVPKQENKSHIPHSLFTVHLQVLSENSALRVSGQSHVASRDTTSRHDLRIEKPLGKKMLSPEKGFVTHPLDRRRRSIVGRHGIAGSTKPDTPPRRGCS